MRFTYVLAGWEGSAHDARVYADALSDPGVEPPIGLFDLADGGYPLKSNLLTPYRSVLYHVEGSRQGFVLFMVLMYWKVRALIL